jgi:cytochrome c-type biogenesis protein CcmH/NrfF
MSRSWIVVGLLLVAGLVAVGVVAGIIAPPPTSDERSREVAATLRCPSCLGETAADSTSPVAESMRIVVDEQLAAGRSPDEVRSWFAEAYGPDVLLVPPARGAAWLLWLVPLAAVVVVAVVLVRGRRSGPALVLAGVAVLGLGAWWLAPTGPDAGPVRATTEATEHQAVDVLRRAVQDQPGRPELHEALATELEAAGRSEEAVEHRSAAVRLRPLDTDLRYRAAFALARTGAQADAVRLLEESLTIDAEHPPSRLLLDALREGSDPARAAEPVDDSSPGSAP